MFSKGHIEDLKSIKACNQFCQIQYKGFSSIFPSLVISSFLGLGRIVPGIQTDQQPADRNGQIEIEHGKPKINGFLKRPTNSANCPRINQERQRNREDGIITRSQGCQEGGSLSTMISRDMCPPRLVNIPAPRKTTQANTHTESSVVQGIE